MPFLAIMRSKQGMFKPAGTTALHAVCRPAIVLMQFLMVLTTKLTTF
jgi:hypothetical protein